MTATVAERIRSRLHVRRTLPAPQERRALREAAGLTQIEIAEAVGATRQAVSMWESGLRNPRGRLLDAYAEALGALREAA